MQGGRWRAALAALATVGVLASASWAQQDETSPCADACYAAEEDCYQICEDADDQAACEERCQEQTAACLERCE